MGTGMADTMRSEGRGWHHLRPPTLAKGAWGGSILTLYLGTCHLGTPTGLLPTMEGGHIPTP